MHEPVEMFTVPASSPPVPTMSSTSSPASTETLRAFMARAKPAISAPVSPLARSSTKNAAICSGSASSSASMEACASASDRSSASQRRSMTWRRSTPAARDTAREGAARRSDAGARPRAANRAEPGARVDAARTDEARGVAGAGRATGAVTDAVANMAAVIFGCARARQQPGAWKSVGEPPSDRANDAEFYPWAIS